MLAGLQIAKPADLTDSINTDDGEVIVFVIWQLSLTNSLIYVQPTFSLYLVNLGQHFCWDFESGGMRSAFLKIVVPGL